MVVLLVIIFMLLSRLKGELKRLVKWPKVVIIAFHVVQVHVFIAKVKQVTHSGFVRLQESDERAIGQPGPHDVGDDRLKIGENVQQETACVEEKRQPPTIAQTLEILLPG